MLGFTGVASSLDEDFVSPPFLAVQELPEVSLFYALGTGGARVEDTSSMVGVAGSSFLDLHCVSAGGSRICSLQRSGVESPVVQGVYCILAAVRELVQQNSTVQMDPRALSSLA